MTRTLLLSLVLLALGKGAAVASDEPGSTFAETEEPGLRWELPGPEAVAVRGAASTPGVGLPRFRIELGFGLASLLVDPEVSEGMGGGISLSYGLHRRIGVEASIFFATNGYDGKLGSFDVAFLSGNISLGPTLQLTRPGGRWLATLDLAIGSYLVIGRPIQEDSWSFGIAFGMTLGLKLTRWFGVGIKPRYHLFNLAHLAGGELKDLKALTPVGVIDRFELPGYLAFYF
jgi:hypothetical protein